MVHFRALKHVIHIYKTTPIVPKKVFLIVEKGVGESILKLFNWRLFYDVFPIGNIVRHCATPKHITIGLKISTLTRHMMYTKKIINGYNLKYLSK